MDPVWHLSRVCGGVCLCVCAHGVMCWHNVLHVCPQVCDTRGIRAELLLFLSELGFAGLEQPTLVCQKKEGSCLSGTPSLLKLRRAFFIISQVDLCSASIFIKQTITGLGWKGPGRSFSSNPPAVAGSSK